MSSSDDPTEQPWSLPRLRSTNERLLLDRLHARGAASRAELARLTGLSKPTVSSALASLEQSGLVREAGRIAPALGRTAVLYEPDPTAGYALGIDIGRSWLRVALADLSGTVVARSDVRNRARSSAAIADLVAATAGELIASSGAAADKVAHAVVGTPGIYDARSGQVRFARNLPGWGKAGLFDRIRKDLGVPLSVHNDANLAALGEYTSGAGAGSRLFVYLMAGTGLGVGVVNEGRLFTGAHGGAGEIGFVPWFGGPGEPCRDKPETLESMTSGHAVTEAARGFGMKGAPTARRVFDAARAGDPAALRAVELEGSRLAHAVAVVTALFDPDLIVLGGGIGHSGDLLLRPLQDTLRSITPLRARVVGSALGDDAVLLGALATALDAARDLTFESRS
ncbi:ROK family transcriptional regulator [Streptomyces sp. NBC_00536]|uniref:ROK family transcriptional regulator n=1 Tax=Streptomyces sp. NBC_00536 TaxID=2975769 RepID=UPI002E80C754|nr:ROK family transcriptional regulator [Streptomyces sp. NBC_00536]WUC77102.1 ROK family transcriptional regulator [Streptomyces sp. NBC_00536]